MIQRQNIKYHDLLTCTREGQREWNQSGSAKIHDGRRRMLFKYLRDVEENVHPVYYNEKETMPALLTGHLFHYIGPTIHINW